MCRVAHDGDPAAGQERWTGEHQPYPKERTVIHLVKDTTVETTGDHGVGMAITTWPNHELALAYAQVQAAIAGGTVVDETSAALATLDRLDQAERASFEKLRVEFAAIRAMLDSLEAAS